MTGESRSVVVRLSLDTAQAIRNSREFGTEMDRAMTTAERSSTRASASLDRVGTSARNMSLVAGAALVASAKAAMDWESEFAGVEKTVDGTTEQLSALEDGLREMARTMPATHQEIAATAEAAGQLGVAGKDIEEFTKVMIELGATTNVTADEGATSIAQFMNVLQSSAGDVDNIAATIVDLGNKGASTEGQILDMAQRVAGAGATIGASEQDILALSAAMANLGIQSELGGGAVQRVLTNINTVVKSGSDQIGAFAEVAGMSADEFARKWSESPIDAFDEFIRGLGEVQDSGGDVVSVLDDLGIKGTQNLQVMLRLAGAGDTLTTALDQSATAWDQNSALIEEYAKRATTTESDVTVSMNNIRDAGIDMGESLLPIVSSVAGGIAGVARAAGSLPDPLQQVAGELLAITAVTGGGAWFGIKTVTGILETRQAIRDLATESPRGARALGALGKAAGGAAAFLAVAAGIRAIQDATDESLPGVNDFTVTLLQLRNGQIQSLGGEFDSLGESIRRMSDKSGTEGFFDAIQTPFKGVFGEAGTLRRASKEIDLLDEALAGLVSQGSPEIAAESLAAVGEAGNLSATQMEELRGILPGYSEALASVAASQLLAGDTAGTAASGLELLLNPLGATEDGMAGVAGAAEDGAAATDDFADAVKGLEGVLGGRSAWRDYEAAIDAATDALKENGRNLNIGTEAGRANQDALDAIAGSALKVAENLSPLKRERFLDRARDDFIGAATDLGMTEGAAGRLATALGLLDKVKVKPVVDIDEKPAKGKINAVDQLMADLTGTTARPRVDADTSNALAKIRAVNSALAGMSDKYVNIWITERHRDAARGSIGPGVIGGAPAGADGMTVPGPRSPYGDKILAYLAPGEEVITNRHGQADQFRADRAAGRIPAYADGGTAGTDSSTKKTSPTKAELIDRAYGQFAVDVKLGTAGVRSELDDLRDALKDAKVNWTDAMGDNAEALTKAARRYDKLSDELKAATAAQADYRAQVAGSIDHDIFGNGLAGLRTQLEADRNDNQAMLAAVQTAVGSGLDGGLLQALYGSGDLTTAQQIATLSPAEIAQLEVLYGGRTSAQQALGGNAAQDIYGDRIKTLESQVRQQQERFDNKVTKLLEDLPHLVGFAVQEGARLGTEGKSRHGSQWVQVGG